MQSAHITIDISSGLIEEADSRFCEWVAHTDLSGEPLDTFLHNGPNSSVSETIKHASTEAGIQLIEVQPKFETELFDTLILYLQNESGGLSAERFLSLQLYPLSAESTPPSEEVTGSSTGLFDSITDFVLVCSPGYTIRKANLAANSVYGAGEPLTGKKCYEALRKKDSPCEDCPLPRTLATRKVQPVEYYDADIAEFMEIRTYPQLDDEGYYSGFTLINRVVSYRREQEHETTQDKKLQALGRMATGIAHDFNNMLTIILGRIQLMKPKLADTNLLDSLRTIEKAAMDSTEIIQRLQDFTRKRERTAEETFTPLSVNYLVEDVVNYARTRTERIKRQRGIHIEIEAQLEEVPMIEGNQASLRNALLNLIYNAIDAMDVGGLITIWTDYTGNLAEIGVSDTGRGMPKEVTEKIFDPFFTTKGEEGNGLGLSEVYGIVNQHSAKIDVESTPGEGTTFLIHFPVLPGQVHDRYFQPQ